jgi:hypothetical protein
MADIAEILAGLNAALTALEPVLDLTAPGAGAIVTGLSAVLGAATTDVPAAEALIAQIKSGAPVTEAQYQASLVAYYAADDQLNADLKADGAT